MTLTRKDCDDLIEALNAWEHKDAAGEFMVTILGALVSNTPEQAAAAEKAEAKIKAAKAGEKQNRIERSIMLKAKLLQMRTRAEVDEVTT